MMRLQTLWASRTRREQIMLAGLGLCVAGILGWYGLIQPVRTWQDQAAHARLASELRLSRISRQIAEARYYETGDAKARAALEQAARQSGLQAQIATQGDGLSFDLDRIASASGRAFLVHLEQQKLSPEILRVKAYEDGTLRISGQTRAGGGKAG